MAMTHTVCTYVRSRLINGYPSSSTFGAAMYLPYFFFFFFWKTFEFQFLITFFFCFLILPLSPFNGCLSPDSRSTPFLWLSRGEGGTENEGSVSSPGGEEGGEEGGGSSSKFGSQISEKKRWEKEEIEEGLFFLGVQYVRSH